MEKHLQSDDIKHMDQRQRATCINSLGGFKSACLIGTKNKNNQTNLAIFNSIVHIGANPPLLGFVVRPDSVERHTLTNILDTTFYTINHINPAIYKQAHQTSARYPLEVSEFKAAGLTELYSDSFFAPYVLESKIRLGLTFREKIDFTINGTMFIIGEITHLYFPENCQHNDGFVEIEKAETITCSGLDSYHTTQKLARLSYAKPTTEITII